MCMQPPTHKHTHGWMHTQGSCILWIHKHTKYRADFLHHQSWPICLVCSLFPRTEKDLLYLYMIANELVGGMRERHKEREKKKEWELQERRWQLAASKIAWTVRLQNNSLFLPDPNFIQSGWIIHCGAMTCREGDKESLLYFDSHNKFMTPMFKKEGKIDEGGREGGSGQVGEKRETRMKQGGAVWGKQQIEE